MGWDFETEPEFEEHLAWMLTFVREEVEVLDLVYPRIFTFPPEGEAAQARTAESGQLNRVIGQFNRPDVTGMRREQEASKLRLAGEPARVAGEANIRSANVAGEAKFQALQELLKAGVQPGQSVSASGVGSVRQAPSPRPTPPAQAPASVTSNLLKAQAANKPNWFDRLRGRTPEASPEVLNAIQEISLAEGVHPDLLKDALSIVASNPGASVDQLLATAEQGGTPLDDNERSQFLRIFGRVR